MISLKKERFTHEITVSRCPMKATEKHFDSLRKTQVITKVSQNAAWIWHFFTKKGWNWKFLEKINVSRWEDWVCSNLLTLMQFFSNLLKVAQTCSNLFKSVQSCTKLYEFVQTYSKLIEIVQTCSSLFKHVETCSNLLKLA